jgi:hypothetical protein
MTVLSPPRHPLVNDALEVARGWCAGHIIDEAPAMRHAVEVAQVLGRHLPDAPPELVAAALLHDAPEFAPADLDLDEFLTVRFSPTTAKLVRSVERQHTALRLASPPPPDVDDPMTLWVTAADKIVSLGSVMHRATLADDRQAYWAVRGAFLQLVPYFRLFHSTAAPHLPAGMAAALGQAVTDAERIGG